MTFGNEKKDYPSAAKTGFGALPGSKRTDRNPEQAHLKTTTKNPKPNLLKKKFKWGAWKTRISLGSGQLINFTMVSP